MDKIIIVKDLLAIINDIFIWFFLTVMFIVGAKNKFEWVTSVRSLTTLIIMFTFCDLASDGKIEPKDFMLIVSLIMNFYFLVKQRHETEEGKK